MHDRDVRIGWPGEGPGHASQVTEHLVLMFGTPQRCEIDGAQGPVDAGVSLPGNRSKPN